MHKRCRRPEYPKKTHYGDWVYITDIGFFQVNDVMGSYTTQRANGKKVRIPLVNRVDVWVATLKEEKKFHSKFKTTKGALWKVKIREK